jgi:iron complex outermembrane receptor protein
MDNSGVYDRMLAGYFVNDARASTEFKVFDQVFGVDVWVNNLLNAEYISNGYTYSYIYGDLITERFYYPQALRNFMVSLRVKF